MTSVTLAILESSTGLNLTGTVHLTATVSPAPQKGVQFYIDNAKLGAPVLQAPYVQAWDTTKVRPGTHTVKAVAIYKTRTYTATLVTSTSAAPPPPPPPGVNTRQAFAGSFSHNPAVLAAFTNLDKYNIVVGQQESIAPVASRVTNGKPIGYFDACNAGTSVNYGCTKADAVANGWALKDSGGNYIHNSGFPDNYITNIGNAGLQAHWLASARAFLAASPGVKGIFVDDVLRGYGALASAAPALYTQASWQAAMLSFVRNVCAPLKEEDGAYVAINADAYVGGDGSSDDGTGDAAWIASLGPYVSACVHEFWPTTNAQVLRTLGNNYDQHWDGWVALQAACQDAGCDFVGWMHSPDPILLAFMVYGKASMLLNWNGTDGSCFGVQDEADDWNPWWTQDIGAPAGPKTAVGVGFARQFTGGFVVINPHPTASQTFTLPPGTWTDPGGTGHVVTITLPAKTANILTA